MSLLPIAATIIAAHCRKQVVTPKGLCFVVIPLHSDSFPEHCVSELSLEAQREEIGADFHCLF